MYAGFMQVSTKDDLEYCKNLIKMSDYARYLQCGFYPPAIPYYALEAELRHIHHHVSEEMIGHIRYAWWREAMDTLGAAHQQHPVLKMLAASGIEKELLVQLVDSYREAYPALPEHPPELPVADVRWAKAGQVIAAHKGARWRLLLKLLII